MSEIKKTMVLFGAGNIGRSFIGQLFSRSGYEVVFIDTLQRIIDALNNKHAYRVLIKDGTDTAIVVNNVRGVQADDSAAVTNEVAAADILATSVGNNALQFVIPAIAAGLKRRYSADATAPLDIIIAENMRDASDYFTKIFLENGISNTLLKEKIGLVETSIGKMVPIMSAEDNAEDPLLVFAEKYNTLILDKKGFKNNLPEVAGISLKENMKAWVDRKSFIHNLGHAATAYSGSLTDRSFEYLYEAIEVEPLYTFVRDTMIQSARALLKTYPDEFTMKGLTEHIDDLIRRFANRALGDTVFRVGRDLQRKLGPEDRLAGAIRMAQEHTMPFDNILFALVCGLYFQGRDRNGDMFPNDKELKETFASKGLQYILETVCGFDIENNKELLGKAEQFNAMIQDGNYVWAQ